MPRIFPFRLVLLPILFCGFALTQCMSPGAESRLSRLEAKQDSILKVLISMQQKTDFVATRVGWKPPADTAPKEIVLGRSHSQGPERAVLTLVEFSDLQCPYCSQSATTLDSFARAYPNDVRVIFKHFPLSFHPQARAAAAAALAAGKQGKFFEFRYRIAPHFRNLKDSTYIAVAKELGLDMNRFKQDMPLTPEVNAILDEDMELGRKLGVEGTPTIFVNGRMAQERSFDYFVSLLKRKG